MKPLGTSIPMAVSSSGVADQSSAARSRLSESAFQALYVEAAPKLQGYLRRACNDAALADDLLQETFLRILRAEMPQLQPHQMKAYLYRTASSLLTDHRRRLKRERQWSVLNLFRAEADAQAES